jgi:hypothetical protein
MLVWIRNLSNSQRGNSETPGTALKEKSKGCGVVHPGVKIIQVVPSQHLDALRGSLLNESLNYSTLYKKAHNLARIHSHLTPNQTMLPICALKLHGIDGFFEKSKIFNNFNGRTTSSCSQ